MPTTIKLRNSVTTTSAPSSLVQGEVAINITDKKVWVGNAATTPIQLLGDGGSASFTSIAFGAGTVSSPSITFTGDTNTGIYSPAADTIAFTEGGVESMRIDSSGNVGIGTSSPTVRLSAYNTAVGNTNQFRVGFSDLFAWDISRDNANTGALTFSNANNASFVERMRIDTSGNLILASGGISLATNQGPYWNNGEAYISYNISSKFLSVGVNSAERMRITSGGDVLVGTTSSAYSASGRGVIEVNGSSDSIIALKRNNTNNLYIQNASDAAYFQNTANTPMVFSTNNAERMRITSGGYLKASNNGAYVSSTGPYHEFISNDASNGVAVVESTNASYTSYALFVGAARNTANNSYYAIGYFNRAALAYRFLVADSGNVTNTNGSYGTISDIKNKENIVDATPKLDKVNQLKVRNFNFIGDDLKQIGFVAQEFEEVFPSMVEEHPDRDAEGNDLGTTTKSIKTSVLVPILVKAMQEQQAMIEELKQEVAKLKGV